MKWIIPKCYFDIQVLGLKHTHEKSKYKFELRNIRRCFSVAQNITVPSTRGSANGTAIAVEASINEQAKVEKFLEPGQPAFIANQLFSSGEKGRGLGLDLFEFGKRIVGHTNQKS